MLQKKDTGKFPELNQETNRISTAEYLIQEVLVDSQVIG
jgi:hypothetical protein